MNSPLKQNCRFPTIFRLKWAPTSGFNFSFDGPRSTKTLQFMCLVTSFQTLLAEAKLLNKQPSYKQKCKCHFLNDLSAKAWVNLVLNQVNFSTGSGSSTLTIESELKTVLKNDVVGRKQQFFWGTIKTGSGSSSDRLTGSGCSNRMHAWIHQPPVLDQELNRIRIWYTGIFC